MKLWHVEFAADAVQQWVEKTYADFPGATIERCSLLGITKSGKYKIDLSRKPVDPSTCFPQLDEAKAYAEKCCNDEIDRKITFQEAWLQKAQEVNIIDVIEDPHEWVVNIK